MSNVYAALHGAHRMYARSTYFVTNNMSLLYPVITEYKRVLCRPLFPTQELDAKHGFTSRLFRPTLSQNIN